MCSHGFVMCKIKCSVTLCSSQPERHRKSSAAAVRSRSDASESARHFNKPRRSSDCTDDVDSVSGDRVPLRDDVYGRRADDHDIYDYKVCRRCVQMCVC